MRLTACSLGLVFTLSVVLPDAGPPPHEGSPTGVNSLLQYSYAHPCAGISPARGSAGFGAIAVTKPAQSHAPALSVSTLPYGRVGCATRLGAGRAGRTCRPSSLLALWLQCGPCVSVCLDDKGGLRHDQVFSDHPRDPIPGVPQQEERNNYACHGG
jgi:hypothetical protein